MSTILDIATVVAAPVAATAVVYVLGKVDAYRHTLKYAEKADAMFAASLGLSMEEYHAQYGRSRPRIFWRWR